jgi:hypothetical protein
MNLIDNVCIKQACEVIMIFHFMEASVEESRTTDALIKEQTRKIMEKTSEKSVFLFLIRDHKWENLFKDESFLSLLDDAQNISALHRFLCIPLKVLSEAFPEETKMYINPKLLI